MNSNQSGHLALSFTDRYGVPKWRWYLLNAFYTFVFLVFGYQIWSTIVQETQVWDPMEAIAYSFWAAYATLMGLGIRYPLKMLPLLLLQLFYKLIWLLIAYLPLKAAGSLDETAMGLYRANGIGVLLDILIIPWGYVYQTILKPIFRKRTQK